MIKGKTSTDRLEELDFDPLEALVKQLENVEQLLEKELSFGPKARAVVLAALVANRTKILETLIPYGYSKVPSTDSQTQDREPIKIVLVQEEEE